ncbi:MAG: exoribonuclease [Thermodesulfobacteriota bacterium]|nr:exoribonuclease [Thermodesulfobacteriota bacterium]
MTQGKVVEYIDEGRFVSAICLQDKGGRLHLLTPSNREVNLSPKRTILISEPTLDVSLPRDDLLERLKQIEETRVRLKEQIDVEGLWELVRDEDETFDHAYLAQLVFGERVTGNHSSAVIRALFENHLYFKMRNGQFLPNSQEKVEQMVRQASEEAANAERLRQWSQWLKEIQEGRRVDDPPFRSDIVHLLIQLALYGKEAPEFKSGRELLSNVGISDIQQARALLIKLGEWEEDENHDLLRSGLEVSFTEDQLAASASLTLHDVDLTGREDLRDLPVLTIDGPLTRDFDDAVSLERVGDELRLGVHIADVASVIRTNSILDMAAAERASSQYLPRRQIPMFPEGLSSDILSLRQGCDRNAISLLARFDRSGALLDYRFAPTVIRVRERLMYEDVNQAMEQDVLLKEMHRLSQRLRQNRMDQGALSLSLPEVEVRFDGNNALFLELVEQETPSRSIIAELMILYNWLAARFCMENQIPILFRSQSGPSEKLPLDEKGYLYYVFQQRRKLSPLSIQTDPAPHAGLGVDAYIHATSPIRRYLDLVNQRQIHHYLFQNGTVYDDKRLEEIRIAAEPTLKKLGLIKRNRLRYWVLKYLSLNRGKKLKALVLDELKTKYRVVLTDFLMMVDLRRKNGVILRQGQEISVRVTKADPWEDILTLEYMEES